MSGADSSGRILGLPVPVVTAIIGVIGTIIVALIGILPAVRHQDQLEIEGLSETVADLKEQLGQFGGFMDPSETWLIRGSVLQRVNNSAVPMSGALVALLPLGNGSLLQHSDDQGEFVFLEVPSGHYILLVAAPGSGVSGRGFIEAVEPTAMQEKGLKAAVVNYSIHPN